MKIRGSIDTQLFAAREARASTRISYGYVDPDVLSRTEVHNGSTRLGEWMIYCACHQGHPLTINHDRNHHLSAY